MNAQIQQYTFAQSNETYEPLTDATVIATATGTSGDALLDNVNYTNISIPFSFPFGESTYTEVNINTNGFLSFGLPTLASVYSPIEYSTNASGIISILGNNLKGFYNVNGLTSTIETKVEGAAPNRVFVIEWKHFRFENHSDAAYIDFNVQTHLHENGTITFLYDTSLAGAASAGNVKVGLRGLTNSDFKTRQANGSSFTWLTTMGGSVGSGVATNRIYANAIPPSGLTFTWTPPVQEVVIENINITPQNNVPETITTNSGTLQLVATVNPENANQNVIWSITSGNDFASINTNGLVTASANGTVTVRATSIADETKSDEIDIVISNQGTTVSFPAPYCDITDNYDVEPITYVNFADIENSSEAVSDVILENFTSITTEVTKNATYTLKVKGNTAGNFENYITAYIDWNQNDIFDASELYLIGTIENSNGNDEEFASLDIVIPSDAELGATRMRIIKSYDDELFQTACEAIDYGQAEDYTIIIANASDVLVTSVSVSTQNNVAAEITQNFGQLQLVASVNPENASQLVNWSITSGEILASVNTQGIVSANGSGNGDVIVRATSVADNTKFAEIVISLSNQVGITEYCEVTVDWDVTPITLVNFSDLNNLTSAIVDGTPAYENFTSMIANVEQGNTYTLTVKGNTDGNFTNDIRVFIDWNQDFVFNMNTEYYHVSLLPSTGEDGVEATIEITIPQNAVLGNTRMRITKDHWNVYEPGEFDSCTDAYYGQIEDYTVNISEASIIVIENVAVSVENNAPAQISETNGTLQLVAVVNPTNANQQVTWSITSGNEFATVDANGFVTASSTQGVSVIRATSVEDETKFDEIEINVVLSIENIEQLKTEIYPNPTMGIVNIQSDIEVREIRIYDVTGKQVMKSNQKTIDMSSLHSGTYILNIIFENEQSVTRKVIKK